jgi:uncharacterized membrane protein YgcG
MVKHICTHRMKEAIIVAVLVAGAAAWFFIRARPQDRAPAKADERDARRAAVSDLRKQAFTGSRAAFGLDVPTMPTMPWGVIMETGFPEGYFTLVALSDGSASIYLSSGGGSIGGGSIGGGSIGGGSIGGGSIGGGAHETIRKASQAMVTLAAKFQPLQRRSSRRPRTDRRVSTS